MKPVKFLNFILSVTAVFLPPPAEAEECNRLCGNRRLPYPFGFSSGCQIKLNCSNGSILAADFPVEDVIGGTILVNVKRNCGRAVEELHRLFTPNFAPTSYNAILLQNCSNQSSNSCIIPTTMVQTHFELVDCGVGNNNTVSCYSEESNTTSFMDFHKLKKSGCRSLFSAISMKSENSTSVSLDVETVRIGWWLPGDCGCVKNAECIRVSPPGRVKSSAHRCECLNGFSGDGFINGSGCRKESSCNLSKYISGNCGGITRVGTLAGGVATGASLMVSLVLIIYFIRKRSEVRNRSRKNKQLHERTGIDIPIYHYKEMEKATDFFSDKRRLGNGAYGTVYSGKLHNDDWVAIKRIKNRDNDTTEQVVNEIKLLSSVSHPNLVRLLGCSIDNEEQILVYEFMPNGTLSQHLQREKGSGLPWPVRLTIAAETAEAISYLHNAMYPPIYHRDIKSSNILLDENYKSKVADFGLSRLGLVESSHISTAPQGTPGYLDPQYHQHFHLSDKSDVYSFGVVLIEIITALKVVDFSRPADQVNLAALAVDKIGKGCLEEIIDPFLEPLSDDWTLTSIHKTAELAFRCLAFHKDMRPSMMEVATELEQIRMSKWTNSDILSFVGSSSSSSSSSNLSEKPLNVTDKKDEFDKIRLFSNTTSLDRRTEFSPDSIENSWSSDLSLPSSTKPCRLVK